MPLKRCYINIHNKYLKQTHEIIGKVETPAMLDTTVGGTVSPYAHLS